MEKVLKEVTFHENPANISKGFFKFKRVIINVINMPNFLEIFEFLKFLGQKAGIILFKKIFIVV